MLKKTHNGLSWNRYCYHKRKSAGFACRIRQHAAVKSAIKEHIKCVCRATEIQQPFNSDEFMPIAGSGGLTAHHQSIFENHN